MALTCSCINSLYWLTTFSCSCMLAIFFLFSSTKAAEDTALSTSAEDVINTFYHKFQVYMYSRTYQAVTCIKRSPFSCPVIDNFICIELLLRGHLSYKDTFCLSQRWPLDTGWTVYSEMRSAFITFYNWINLIKNKNHAAFFFYSGNKHYLYGICKYHWVSYNKK